MVCHSPSSEVAGRWSMSTSRVVSAHVRGRLRAGGQSRGQQQRCAQGDEESCAETMAEDISGHDAHDTARQQQLRGNWRRRLFGPGQEEREDGAVVDGMLAAAEGEAALVPLDDSGGDPEAEAGPVEIFGGVEGLEEAGANLGRHAVAGVGDGDADAFAARRVADRVVCCVVGADDEAAALAHGVDGVGDEVVEDLADVVFKAEDAGLGGVGWPRL